MIESFKKGGKVPRRVAWEIILGVHRWAEKQKSLVEVVIHKGATCDVVGDSEFGSAQCGWRADTFQHMGLVVVGYIVEHVLMISAIL